MTRPRRPLPAAAAAGSPILLPTRVAPPRIQAPSPSSGAGRRPSVAAGMSAAPPRRTRHRRQHRHAAAGPRPSHAPAATPWAPWSARVRHSSSGARQQPLQPRRQQPKACSARRCLARRGLARRGSGLARRGLARSTSSGRRHHTCGRHSHPRPVGLGRGGRHPACRGPGTSSGRRRRAPSFRGRLPAGRSGRPCRRSRICMRAPAACRSSSPAAATRGPAVAAAVAATARSREVSCALRMVWL